MNPSHPSINESEHDFALIVGGIPELTPQVQDALFEAGCDDATLSIQYGLLYVDFSRSANSLREAIITAVRDVLRSGLPVQILRVDDCNLVTASDIARRIERSRQLVHQYMRGQRGPGGFPPPVCRLSEHAPLWEWCAVSYWLAQSNLLRPQESLNAEVVDAINTVLEERLRQRTELLTEIATELQAIGLS